MGTGGVEKHWLGLLDDPNPKLRFDTKAGGVAVSSITNKNNSSPISRC